MTDKTTKTPQSDQNSSVANDKAVSDPAGRNKPSEVSSDRVAAKTAATPTPPKSNSPTKTDAGKTSEPVTNDKSSSDKPESKPESKPEPKPAASTGGAGSGKSTTPPGAEPSRKKSSSAPLVVLAIAVLLLAGGLAYQYLTSQQNIERLESQSRASADQARQAEQKAQQALDALNEQRNMITALRSELRESSAELDSLSSAFQTITDRGSDLVLLNDIDHLVMIAQQQLQLNGNVANAIISLETAQAQLARANRPALASLQQTINGDLDRLRAVSTVDIALLSARLDELAGLVSQAPLLVPDGLIDAPERAGREPVVTPQKGAAAPASSDDVWWEKALSESWQWTTDTLDSLRQEFGQFISVRRVDDSAALLISPDQATRFRDSLRQRIMTAQLALMMDQSLIWETETDALLKAVESRFDPESSVTRQAVRVAREIADTAIDTPMPDVSNSINALEAINEQMGRRAVSDYSSNGVSSSADTEEQAAEAGSNADDVQSGTDNATGSPDDAPVRTDDASGDTVDAPGSTDDASGDMRDTSGKTDDAGAPAIADDADVEQG